MENEVKKGAMYRLAIPKRLGLRGPRVRRDDDFESAFGPFPKLTSRLLKRAVIVTLFVKGRYSTIRPIHRDGMDLGTCGLVRLLPNAPDIAPVAFFGRYTGFQEFVSNFMRGIGIEGNFTYIPNSIVHSIPGNQQNNVSQVRL
jgi:hypothetical protein